jgi:putative ABC transport system permease protein
MSYSVSRGTSEIGIRVALGAAGGDVLKMVLRETLALALAGVALGLAGAFAMGRALQSLLFGVRATDPLTFSLVTALLLGVAALASYLPARRAARIDPLLALRQE